LLDNGVDNIRRARRRSRLIACLVVWAVALGVGLVGTGTIGGPADPAQAASGGDFDPGMIISDAKFYDGDAMSQGDIRTFLRARVPSCASGYVCLKDYVESTPARAADSRCSSLQASRLSGADIVYWVGRACGVSQSALLVLLEKEQGLVTDSTPSARQFRSATGYGCPDTAACDSLYYGFFNQVYNAAHQFKVYQSTPTRWNYQAGRSNRILWHPNADCGSSQVTIRNQATAGLYIYTPYQPNAAALRNLYGTGDSCSSYGNRNFWRLYTDWFGSTGDGPVSSFVKTAADATVFLVSGGQKHQVPDLDVYRSLSALGGISTVPRSYLDGLPTGVAASALVRDPASGSVGLVQADRRHRFPSCDLVAVYGYGCGDAVDLDARQLAALPERGLRPAGQPGHLPPLRQGQAPRQHVVRRARAERRSVALRRHHAPGRGEPVRHGARRPRAGHARQGVEQRRRVRRRRAGPQGARPGLRRHPRARHGRGVRDGHARHRGRVRPRRG
jgi:hypothetical protein